MAEFARDEVEAAFRGYWPTGGVGEDWAAWADLFTDDGDHLEHVLGRRQGREQIRQWIKPTMERVPGQGRWSCEEGYWVPGGGMAATRRYQEAGATHDPGHPQPRSRRHWPTEPSWAAPGQRL